MSEEQLSDVEVISAGNERVRLEACHFLGCRHFSVRKGAQTNIQRVVASHDTFSYVTRLEYLTT
jgi:hypothetical protein